jgi:DNA helicase II / ATP-dependent DNA helicase PcrA
VSADVVQEVKKEQNRRNPRLVYELANKLRTDGVIPPFLRGFKSRA